MDKKTIDYKLLFAVYLLVIFGMVMISSVSVYSSYTFTNQEENSYFLVRNIAHILISTVLLFAIVKLDYKKLVKFSPVVMWMWILSLISVLLFWKIINWARWWLDIPILPFAIQPAEFVKVWVIIFLAYLFWRKIKNAWDFKYWFLPYIVTMFLVLWLIWMQPDFGSILVIAPVSWIIFFVAWGNFKHLLLLIASWILLLVWVYNAWKYDPSAWEERPAFWYIYDRFNSFLWTEEDETKKSDIQYQQDQAVIAIWTWWLSWVWFWNSVQKFWYIPEVQWDFIYSVYIEELGFVWGLFLLFMYFYIAFRGLQIYRYSKDDFARYYAIWVSSRILLQAFVNISVNLKLLPNTGITLPFISYWGSSLMSLMIAVWFLLSISKNTENTPVSLNRKGRGSIDTSVFMIR